MRRVLVHYHIFKNAGTTVEEILLHSFFDRFYKLDSPETNTVLSNRDLVTFVRDRPQLQAVTSHQIRYPLPEAPNILFFDVCFLRDPLDRLRSIYDYFREKPFPGLAQSDLANAHSIGDFLERMVNDHPWLIQDAQVNILAGRSPDDPPATRTEFEAALRTMRATAFLGVVDLFRESLVAGAYFLRPIFPYFDLDQPASNVSAARSGIEAMREACKPQVWEEVLRLNALDLELLEKAREEVARRYAIAGGAGFSLQRGL